MITKARLPSIDALDEDDGINDVDLMKTNTFVFFFLFKLLTYDLCYFFFFFYV